MFPLVDCTVGVASPGHARQAQISRFLLVLGTEDVLALSKDTIGTAWASRVCLSKNYDSNGFLNSTQRIFWVNGFFEFSKKKLWKRTGLAQGIRMLGGLVSKVGVQQHKGESSLIVPRCW